MGMGFGASSSSFSLLCAEDSASVLGSDDGGEGEVPELGRNLGFAGLQPESDELVWSLMAKEKEQLVEVATAGYLERLNGEGLELSWRTDSIEWICKVQAHYSFGPLCVYLAVNYLDRFLSSKQLPLRSPSYNCTLFFLHRDDTPWMQQLVAVACISLAAKMEETVVPQSIDLQVCEATHVFEAKAIQRMEVLVISTLKWRMHSVTPFSYIDYFLNIFNEGKPLTNDLVSRCTKLILGTLKETKFLQFEPSVIAAAVALSAAAEAQAVDFNSALVDSEIPLNKENVRRCCEAIQEMALEENNAHISASPSGVLGASCFTYSDGSSAPGSSQTTSGNYGNNSQSSSPISKRTRLSSSPMV